MGDLRFVTDAELREAGVPPPSVRALRSHRLLALGPRVSGSSNAAGSAVPDKLASATPEELKRLWCVCLPPSN